MAEGSYSLSDIASIMGNRKDGFLEGNGIIILILFFLIFGFGGNGWGNNASAQGATTAELYASLGSQDMKNDIRSGFQNVNDGICGLNSSIQKGTYDTSLQLNNGFNSVTAAINNLGYQNQQCCCELKTAIHAEGEATRALITENEVQRLRTDLQSAQLTLANAAQTQNILGSLGTYYTNPSFSPNCGCGF